MKRTIALALVALALAGCSKYESPASAQDDQDSVPPVEDPEPVPEPSPPLGSITVEVRNEYIPLADVTAKLAGPEARSAYTGNNGQTVFANLTLGRYTVSIENFPADVVFPLVSQGVELAAGQAVTVVFAGWPVYAPPPPIPPLPPVLKATITGVVYEDANGNRKHDAGEPVFTGFNVGLLGWEQRSGRTSSDGRYVFSGLERGSYDVVFTNPDVGAYRFDFERNGFVSFNVSINDDEGTMFIVDFRAVRR